MELETNGSGERGRVFGVGRGSLHFGSKLTSLQSNLFLKNSIERIHKSAYPTLVAWYSAVAEITDVDKVLNPSWTKDETFCLPANSIVWFKKQNTNKQAKKKKTNKTPNSCAFNQE